jgi:hypothetical protein
VTFGYQTCDRCGGCGFAPLFGPLFIRCRRCGGTGERKRAVYRIFQALRHGAATREDY